MDYKFVEEEVKGLNADNDSSVAEMIKIVSDFIGCDLSKLKLENIYDLNVFLKHPENYLEADSEIIEKINLLYQFLED